jgi:hypothetical protein
LSASRPSALSVGTGRANGTVCGKTTHLSRFAIAEMPSTTTVDDDEHHDRESTTSTPITTTPAPTPDSSVTTATARRRRWRGSSSNHQCGRRLDSARLDWRCDTTSPGDSTTSGAASTTTAAARRRWRVDVGHATH